MTHVIGEINEEVCRRIREYADKEGVSYEEASKRCYVSINGVKVEPVSSEISFEPRVYAMSDDPRRCVNPNHIAARIRTLIGPEKP